MQNSSEDRGWAIRDVIRLHRARRYRDPALGGAVARAPRRAIVLAGGPGERLVRLTERLTGSPLPKQFCAFGDETSSLLQGTLHRLGRHVPPEQMRVVIDRTHRALALRQVRAMPDVDVMAQPADCGTAIGTLVPLIDALVEDPDAVVVVAPADHAVSDAGAFDRAMQAAFDVVDSHDGIVVLGAEPDGTASDDGWLVPYGPPLAGTRCPLQPVARYVHETRRDETVTLLEAGAVHSTSLLVARGSSLLEAFERITPRLLRLFLYGAGMKPAQGSDFLEMAYDGLGSLDLAADILSLAHGLRMVVLPREAGWSDLGTEARVFAWLAKRRGQGMSTWPLARSRPDPAGGYRRVGRRADEAAQR